MVLREVIKEDKDKIIEMYKEYMEYEPMQGVDRFEGIRDFEKLDRMDFIEWLEELEKNKHRENLPETYSTHTLYLVIKDDGNIIGAVGVRWEKVPVLITYGGFIGYSIRPTQRGKGYANEMLRLALEKFHDKKVKDILITCKDFNVASKRVIERNGGIFENEYYNKDDGYTYLRYWIKI